MIAALYLRSAVSNDDAIAEQRSVCTAHAVAQGWQIGDIFIDNGVSGVSDDRPGLDALRDYLRDGSASVLVAEDGTRLFRSISKLAEFVGFCGSLGVELSCARPFVFPSDLMQLEDEPIPQL
jgi:DNA invertase Pin-like site-specific DNA recombinase